MQFVDFHHLLPLVAKPSRYIDHEINAARRSPQDFKARICLAFPDVYELGVSHLGLKILYSIINQRNDVMADRCYLPWADLLELMSRDELPLWGLESGLAVKDFDILGITLQSELTYSNVLELLHASQIPILTAERDEHSPIVLAGGHCTANPLPLKDFIDVFFIGEAEEAIGEMTDVLLRHNSRHSRLEALGRIEGCYVPFIHDPILAQDGSFRIKARKFSQFHTSSHLHNPQLLSWQLATHNRYVAEIMRGCSRGCRFCQAGFICRPVRERNPKDILAALLKEVKQSGWDEVGLMSLSSADYTCIKDLLFMLWKALDTRKTHVSLPSLRVDSLDEDMAGFLKGLGREGLTIAPEAGSQRLRDVINKNITEEEICRGVEIAQELGWQRIKLYFMLGLPTETDDDITAIIDLILKISSQTRHRMQISVTLSPFVPKPFTPFQYCAFEDATLLLDRAMRIKRAFVKHRNIKIKYHDVKNSLLEALLARGDEVVGKVLLSAWEAGARFDGWNECFDFSLWQNSLITHEVKLPKALGIFDPDSILPWDFIDYGICKDWLIQEYEKAKNLEVTPDCRELCSLCGVCDDQIATINARPDKSASFQPQDSAPKALAKRENAPQFKFRIHYRKTGLLRYISHLDWMRMLFRIVAKTELDTVFTQGFSPHPKVSLAPPLPLGVQSQVEYFDVAFYTKYTIRQLIDAYLVNHIPDFDIYAAEPIIGKPKLPTGESISYQIPDGLMENASGGISQFKASTDWMMEKRGKDRIKQYDLSQIIQEIDITDSTLTLTKSLTGPSIWDILASLLNCPKEELYKGVLCRNAWAFE